MRRMKKHPVARLAVTLRTPTGDTVVEVIPGVNFRDALLAARPGHTFVSADIVMGEPLTFAGA